MANFTYINADNSAGDSTDFALSADQDVIVKKIIFGDPADGDITILHSAIAQPGHASGMGSVAVGEAAFRFTQGTAAAGIERVREIDFSDGTPNGGLPLNGGSIHTDSPRTTVIWDLAS